MSDFKRPKIGSKYPCRCGCGGKRVVIAVMQQGDHGLHVIGWRCQRTGRTWMGEEILPRK
jgi:hypothetical protein